MKKDLKNQGQRNTICYNCPTKQSSIDNLNSTITSLRYDIANKNFRNNELNLTVTNLSNELNLKEDRVANLNATINTQQIQISGRDNELAMLKGRVTSLAQETNRFKEQININVSKLKDVALLKNQISAQSQEIDNLKEQIRILGGEPAAANTLRLSNSPKKRVDISEKNVEVMKINTDKLITSVMNLVEEIKPFENKKIHDLLTQINNNIWSYEEVFIKKEEVIEDPGKF